MTKKREAIVLLRKTNPVTEEVLEKAYELGVIPKKELKHGAYYIGSCRNSSIAQWDSKEDRFIYIRNKFGTSFLETIEHPEDDTGFDIFVPVDIVEIGIDDE